MSLINRKYLKQIIFDAKIKIFKSSVKVKSINSFVYDSFEYVFMNFYVSDHIKFEEKAVTHFIRKLHIVEKLKVKMLIKMNILNFEEIDVLYSTRKIIIFSCEDFIANLIITLKN